MARGVIDPSIKRFQPLDPRQSVSKLKLSGVVTVVAAILLLAVGAGSASGTVLCSTETSPCTGTAFGLGTGFKAVLQAGGKWSLMAPAGTMSCTESIIEGKVENAGSATTSPAVFVENLIIAKCSCPLSVTERGRLIWHYTGSGDGTVTEAKTGFTSLSCFGTPCRYGGPTSETTLGTMTGGSPALLAVTAAKIPLVEGSLIKCGTSGTVNATYEVTAPNPLFLAAS